LIWGNAFRDLGPSNAGACPPPARTACSRAGSGCGRGSPLPMRGYRGVTLGNFFEIFDAKSCVWGQSGPENKPIEGQPNEYDVICRNASVLAFHRWPTIFAGAPLGLQNICRNGVPPRSRTTTPPLRPTCGEVTSLCLRSRCDRQFVRITRRTDGRTDRHMMTAYTATAQRRAVKKIPHSRSHRPLWHGKLDKQYNT